MKRYKTSNVIYSQKFVRSFSGVITIVQIRECMSITHTRQEKTLIIVRDVDVLRKINTCLLAI